jgi:hypothetical protein
MSKARLDLRGIDLNEIRSKRSRRKGLHIESAPTIQVIEQRPGVPYKYICVCIFIMIVCFSTIHFSFSSLSSTPSVKKHVHKTGQLRRMIRMNCRSKQLVTYCTTTQNVGDYVVSLNGCEDVYEFNGIPFTDIYKDANGNYRIPNSVDHQLKIREHCDKITATVDTNEHSYEEYASSYSLSIYNVIERIVWITDKCYTDFTVLIDNQIIFEKTPSTMITSFPLKNKVAYTYESGVSDLKGSISIRGTGCDQPIFIYTKGMD